ncbi:hypothetical protein ACS0TY_020922 [Phlomoides rotata]
MHRQASTSRAVDLLVTSQPASASASVFSTRKKMDETTDLPLYYRNSSVNKKDISRSRLAAKFVHLIPAVVLLCIFILWCFSYEVSLERSNGRIAAARLLKTQKTMFSNLTYPPYPSISEMQITGNVSIAR